MTRKRVPIEPTPRSRAGGAGASAEQWIRGRAAANGHGGKRLTIDIDEGLHRRLRIRAASEGRTMADVVRALLEDACPDGGPWP